MSTTIKVSISGCSTKWGGCRIVLSPIKNSFQKQILMFGYLIRYWELVSVENLTPPKRKKIFFIHIFNSLFYILLHMSTILALKEKKKKSKITYSLKKVGLTGLNRRIMNFFFKFICCYINHLLFFFFKFRNINHFFLVFLFEFLF